MIFDQDLELSEAITLDEEWSVIFSILFEATDCDESIVIYPDTFPEMGQLECETFFDSDVFYQNYEEIPEGQTVSLVARIQNDVNSLGNFGSSSDSL